METILKNPQRYKKIISKFYKGRCLVEVREPVKDKASGKVKFSEPIVLYEDVPCFLDSVSSSLTTQYEINETPKTIRLFLDNEYKIPSGSRITVNQDGKEDVYGCVSEPNLYETHQELEMQIWRNWS